MKALFFDSSYREVKCSIESLIGKFKSLATEVWEFERANKSLKKLLVQTRGLSGFGMRKQIQFFSSLQVEAYG